MRWTALLLALHWAPEVAGAADSQDPAAEADLSSGAADRGGPAPTAEFQARLNGRYLPVLGDEEVQPLLDEAVDEAVSHMTWAFRPFARYRLRKTARQCPWYDLELTEELFTLHCGDDGAWVSRLDNDGGPLIDEGEAFEVIMEVREPAVTMTVQDHRGGQRTTWTLEGADDLTVDVHIFSDRHLPEPLVWSLRYHRHSATRPIYSNPR